MPIWFELIFIMLVAYAIGLGIGWLLWARSLNQDNASDSENTTKDFQ